MILDVGQLIRKHVQWAETAAECLTAREKTVIFMGIVLATPWRKAVSCWDDPERL